MKTPNTTGTSEASAKTPTEQREQRQWWTHDEGTVHHLTGYSCGPLNPTYWWCPKIGSSLPESQLFTEESAAKDAAKEACRKRIEQWSQKLVALEAPDLLAELARLREERDQLQERCSSEWAVAIERDQAREELSTLRATNAGLAADKERLDWLESNGDHLYGQGYEGSGSDEDGWQIGAFTDGSQIVNLYGKGPTLRAAIDESRAALDAAKGGEA